jgi:hypothetical protein
MAGPQHNTKLPTEVLEALGDLRGAARQLSNEIKEMERASLQLLSRGEAVPKDLRERLSSAQSKHDQLKADERIKATVQAETKKSFLKTAAGFFSYHNPHGMLRTVLSGNVGPSHAEAFGHMLQSAGKKISSVSPKLGLGVAEAGTGVVTAANAGAVAAAAAYTKRLIDTIEESSRQQEGASRINLGISKVRQQQSMRQRTMRDISAEESLVERQSLTRMSSLEANNVGRGAHNDFRVLALGALRTQGRQAEIDAERRAGTEKFFNLARRAAKMGDVEGLLGSGINPAVLQHATSFHKLGVWHGVKANWFNWLSGEGDAIREKASIDEANKMLEAHIQKAEENLRAHHEVPMNRTIERQHEQYLRVVEEDQHARFSQWNPY